MANQWTEVLSPAELAARTAFTATLDPAFAARDKAFYDSRTAAQLRSLVAQAWKTNQADSYQVARSYLELKAPQ